MSKTQAKLHSKSGMNVVNTGQECTMPDCKLAKVEHNHNNVYCTYSNNPMFQPSQQKDDFCHCHRNCPGFKKDNALCLCLQQECEHCTQQKDADTEIKDGIKQQKDAGEWEDEFDKRFCFTNFDGQKHYQSLHTNKDQTDDIKAFINQVETQARQQGEAYKGKQNRESYMKGIKEGRQQAYNSGFCDGVKAQQDIIEKEIRANIEKRINKVKE